MIDSWAEPEVARSAPLDHYWYANGACGSKTPFWSLLIAPRTKANDSVEVILLGWVDVIHSAGVDVREEKCSFTIGEFMTLIYARLFTWRPRRRSSSINREGSPADVREARYYCVLGSRHCHPFNSHPDTELILEAILFAYRLDYFSPFKTIMMYNRALRSKAARGEIKLITKWEKILLLEQTVGHLLWFSRFKFWYFA